MNHLGPNNYAINSSRRGKELFAVDGASRVFLEGFLAEPALNTTVNIRDGGYGVRVQSYWGSARDLHVGMFLKQTVQVDVPSSLLNPIGNAYGRRLFAFTSSWLDRPGNTLRDLHFAQTNTRCTVSNKRRIDVDISLVPGVTQLVVLLAVVPPPRDGTHKIKFQTDIVSVQMPLQEWREGLRPRFGNCACQLSCHCPTDMRTFSGGRGPGYSYSYPDKRQLEAAVFGCASPSMNRHVRVLAAGGAVCPYPGCPSTFIEVDVGSPVIVASESESGMPELILSDASAESTRSNGPIRAAEVVAAETAQESGLTGCTGWALTERNKRARRTSCPAVVEADLVKLYGASGSKSNYCLDGASDVSSSVISSTDENEAKEQSDPE